MEALKLRITGLDIGVLLACVALAAVVALPRHVQLTADARRADVEGLAHRAELAAERAHELWERAGRPPTVEGRRGRVAMIHGYPSTGTLALMLSEPEQSAFLHGRGLWQHAEVDAASPCGISYLPPGRPGSRPVIAMRLDGC